LALVFLRTGEAQSINSPDIEEGKHERVSARHSELRGKGVVLSNPSALFIGGTLNQKEGEKGNQKVNKKARLPKGSDHTGGSEKKYSRAKI